MSRCTIVDVCRCGVAAHVPQIGKRQRALLVRRPVQHRLERAKRRQLGHEAAARRLDRDAAKADDVLVQQLTEQARLGLEVGEIVRREHLLSEQLDGDRLPAPRAGKHDAVGALADALLHRHFVKVERRRQLRLDANRRQLAD
jgi:hypothetical protein